MKAPVCWAAAMVLVAGAAAHACDGLTARDGWVATPPPGAQSHAGYLTLLNDGAASQTLTGLTAPGYAAAMLHESVMEGGLMKMRHLSALEIPPGGQVVLAPHGRHLMLMGPQGVVSEGDSVAVALACADGGVVQVELSVRRVAFDPVEPEGAAHSPSHNHGAH